MTDIRLTDYMYHNMLLPYVVVLCFLSNGTFAKRKGMIMNLLYETCASGQGIKGTMTISETRLVHILPTVIVISLFGTSSV